MYFIAYHIYIYTLKKTQIRQWQWQLSVSTSRPARPDKSINIIIYVSPSSPVSRWAQQDLVCTIQDRLGVILFLFSHYQQISKKLHNSQNIFTCKPFLRCSIFSLDEKPVLSLLSTLLITYILYIYIIIIIALQHKTQLLLL